MGRHPSRRHTSPEQAPVGRRIRRRRRELGLTQADLAGPEYTKSFISQLEGGYADPSLDTLRFLGRKLSLSLSSMAGDAEDQMLATLDGLLAWAQGAQRSRRIEAARRALALAREMAAQAGSALYRTEAALRLAHLEIETGDTAAAAAALDEADAYHRTLGVRFQTRAALLRGWLHVARGDLDAAAAGFRQVLGQVRKAARHPDLAAEALLGLGTVALRNGDVRQARRRLQSAHSVATRAHLRGLETRALVRLATVERLEGRLLEARQHLQAAVTAAQSVDDHRVALEADLHLGAVLSELAQPAEAVATLRRAAELARRVSDTRGEIEALLALSDAALAAGDAGLAQQAAAEAAACADRAGDRRGLQCAALFEGRALLAMDRTDEGIVRLTAAVDGLAAVGALNELAEAAEVLGAAYRARNAHEDAARYLGIALEARRDAPPEDPWRRLDLVV